MGSHRGDLTWRVEERGGGEGEELGVTGVRMWKIGKNWMMRFVSVWRWGIDERRAEDGG